MYIGRICHDKDPEFYRAGTTVPCPPTPDGDELVWRWDTVFDTEIDIIYDLDAFCYVGAVELHVSGAEAVSLYVDDVKIAVRGCGVIPVGQSGRRLTVRLTGELKEIRLSKVEIIGFYPEEDEPLMLPRPKVSELRGARLPLGEIMGDGEDAAFAAEFLAESLSERFGYARGEGVDLCFIIDPEYESERYTVSSSEYGITVRSASRLGLLWGACRVIDLYDDGTLPEIEIDDRPDRPMRGFHMGLPRRDRIEFVKRLFRYVLLPLGYNHVIIEFNGAMRFDRHPEIAEKWLEAEANYRAGKQPRIQHAEMGADGTVLEKREVGELIDLLHDYGIEVIPEVQSFGHVQYLTYAHPEIAEVAPKVSADTDERNQDVMPDDFYAHAYCPSREDSLALIYDIIDEIVEVARPTRYVHIGHDEVYQVGSCPVCKKKGAGPVYRDHVLALHSYMKAKGLGIMIWSDMLHRGVHSYSDPTADMKSELPSDIVMLDFTWYFALDREIEDELLDAGFSVMMGNLYSSHYPRYKKRMAKRGMIGGEISTWLAVSEESFGEGGKFFDLVYTAEMLWNAESYDERERVALTALIGQCILPEMRDLIRGKYALYLEGDPEEAELIGSFPGSDENVPEELGYLSVTEPTGPIELGYKYDRIIFEHATLYRVPRVAWKPLYVVGHYRVVYEGGEQVDVPVRFGGGILNWNTLYGEPMKDPYYRHLGYSGTWFADPTYEARTAEGEPILFLGQVFDNPHPERIIERIEYIPSEGDYARLISAGVLGIKL